MNHAISINSDKTLVITLPEGTQVDRVMIRKMGTQESKLYWRDEVLDQYKWERDIAIQQLKELGYGFGQEPKTDGDTISRKAAIDVASRECHEWRGIFSDIEQGLKELPSVQSELAKYSPKLDNENGELISRQAAIDAWKEDFKGFVNSLDMLRDDYKGIMEYIDELPSAEPQWIPCSERLPEINGYHESDTVLCYTDMGIYTFSLLQENIFGQCGFECERDDDYHVSAGKVIAWMPLPESYKEEEK